MLMLAAVVLGLHLVVLLAFLCLATTSVDVAALRCAAADTAVFYWSIYFYWVRGGTYSAFPKLANRPKARLHLYGLLGVTFNVWSLPHYRNRDFHDDLVKNLRNVAIPRTGVPLSLVCYTQAGARLFCLAVYPLIAAVAALCKAGDSATSALQLYSQNLLSPDNWFALWQLNCRLTSLHASVTGDSGFAMENKWTFLQEGEAKGVPVSPFLKLTDLVVKDKNEEGGMGIFMFRNAVHGGDFIVQEKFGNSAFLRGLLPDDAPLSTLRIVTASRHSYRLDAAPPGAKSRKGLKPQAGASNKVQEQPGTGAGAAGSAGGNGPATPGKAGTEDDDVWAMCCVFRAGRSGAKTDHSSVLFDVDLASGQILGGTTNQHWYQLGASALLRPQSGEAFEHHPDTQRKITGEVIPDMASLVDVVCNAHATLLPNVPLAGWDVALTDRGVMLLEANLSCNFFQASYDQAKYLDFADRVFRSLDQRTALQQC